MPDPREEAFGTNPNVPDDQEDPDGDGLTNEEEFEARTDPLDPGSLLRLDLEEIDNGKVMLRFDAIAGKTYSVRYRNSLTSGSWSTLVDVPAQAIDLRITVRDVPPDPDQTRFYQLVTPAGP